MIGSKEYKKSFYALYQNDNLWAIGDYCGLSNKCMPVCIYIYKLEFLFKKFYLDCNFRQPLQTYLYYFWSKKRCITKPASPSVTQLLWLPSVLETTNDTSSESLQQAQIPV